MCLANPGKITSIDDSDSLLQGRVSFSGVAKTVCLAYTPDANVGDFVLVHAGFALSIIKADTAENILQSISLGQIEEGA
jgi:hydrogenase expression/formation protein HypC